MGIIKFQKKGNMEFTQTPGGVRRAAMLPGMVPGVETYKCQVQAGQRVTLDTLKDTTQLLYFTSGEGYITTNRKAFNITEPSLFIPEMEQDTSVLQAVTDMEYLQLTCAMLDEDKELWSHWHIALPYFLPQANFIPYIEGFRPEAIRALSILDRHWVCRMTMGAIIGNGPSKADPHSHHNLYQWYYGMPGTKFTYRAGGEEILLEAGDWAFIPLNIEHAIEIAENETVNYVWFEIEVPEKELNQ